MERFNHIGKKIRRLMREKGISYRRLAREAGISRKTVELAVRKPESRTLKTMEKIAEVLGVSLEELIREEKNDRL